MVSQKATEIYEERGTASLTFIFLYHYYIENDLNH